jgi:predicted Fe-Mo cluster-binding NifX family protein
MSTIVCVPMNTDGTVTHRLGQAPLVAVCRIDDGHIEDWSEHAVEWDTTYGVDVLGVHHPRVIRFLRDNEVEAVVADQVCDSMQSVLDSLVIRLYPGLTGDARAAVVSVAPTLDPTPAR